jgi:hypothetical protein
VVFNTVNKSHAQDKTVWKEVFKSWTKGAALPLEARVPGTRTLFLFAASGRPITLDPALQKQPTSERLAQAAALFADLPEADRAPAEAKKDLEPGELKYSSGGGRYTGEEPPPGRLVLRTFGRVLAGDATQGYHPARLNNSQFVSGQSDCLEGTPKFEAKGAFVPEPLKDTFWLTEAEWTALAPDDLKQGDPIAVSQAAVRRLLLYGCHNWWAAETLIRLWSPEAVRKGTLTATVIEKTPTRAVYRLDGEFVMTQEKPYKADYRGRIEGRLTYDFEKKAFSRFDMLVLGDFQGIWFCRANQTFGPVPLAFAFELARGNKAVDDVLPIGFLPHKGGKLYLNPPSK